MEAAAQRSELLYQAIAIHLGQFPGQFVRARF
jgi:hypothetical protein